jgi:hypothetical protein
LSNVSLGLAFNRLTNASLGLAFDKFTNASLGLAFDKFTNASLGLANNSYTTNASVGSALITNVSLGLANISYATNASVGLIFASNASLGSNVRYRANLGVGLRNASGNVYDFTYVDTSAYLKIGATTWAQWKFETTTLG